MRKFYFFCILAAVTLLHTGCFLLMGSSSSSGYSSSNNTTTTDPEPAKPTVDYAPQTLRHGAYISFVRPGGESVKIVFESNYAPDIPECNVTNGRLNAAYYRYDGFNMSSLTYNYNINGEMSKQYKAELNFTHETGGTIVFLESNQTTGFTYRP